MLTLNVKNGQHSHGTSLVHEAEKLAFVALFSTTNQLNLQSTQLWMSDKDKDTLQLMSQDKDNFFVVVSTFLQNLNI